jgi:hypothetical protein
VVAKEFEDVWPPRFSRQAARKVAAHDVWPMRLDVLGHGELVEECLRIEKLAYPDFDAEAVGHEEPLLGVLNRV